MKKLIYMLVFASSIVLAGCGGDSYSASGSGTITTDGSSTTQIELPATTTPATTTASGTNSEGECSEISHSEGKC